MRLDVPEQDAVVDDIPNVVVVDPHFEHYKPLAASARLGKLNLHFRATGSDAMKFARRHRVDAWLIAVELDDMSGHDFVELLQAKLTETHGSAFAAAADQSTTKVAMVEADHKDGRWTARTREAVASGADSLLSKPITFRDLEALLGVSHCDEPRHLLLRSTSPHAFVTLPIGVGAAVVAIAVLMMG